MGLPKPSAKEILEIAELLLHKKISEKMFRSLFGISSFAFRRLWGLLTKIPFLIPKKWKILHLFMTLNFLKNPQANLNAISIFWRKSSITLLKFVKITLKLLNSRLPEVN